ncbi:HD-GYP domain-containing protein [Desulforamulus aquiferis]|uniref:HD domain-containing protein n=1 Tax=Desulforamulus aquiferis TaxID=1397668 RepID=A0AAW7Z744_9FIRM|nr:HD domain-containing phosphohydrolase [Desulforamulus aquiferis]MDO7785813.1 HD domain-containing protein [Desulforamulus aquiferis]
MQFALEQEQSPFVVEQELLRVPALSRLACKMNAWDKSLLDHANHTAKLVVLMSEHLGLTQEEKRDLIVGAFLHDIGKITWPRSMVYRKCLTKKERALIFFHPTQGARLLSAVWPEVSSRTLRIVAEHHERPDKTGYPKGLRDTRISTLSLVVAAAEVFSALTQSRPYRSFFFTSEQALEELTRGRIPINLIRILERCIKRS